MAWRYWMGDDEGGFDGFDDGGFDDDNQDDGYDDSGDDDSGYGDDDQEDPQDAGDDDSDNGDTDGEDDGAAAGGDGGSGGDGGDDGNGDLDDSFSDPDDLIGLDQDTALSADDFPNATDADFQDDDGSWTAGDYQESAQNLFGDHDYFGDTMAAQRADEGYTPFAEPGFSEGFEQVAPGSSETLQLFERDGQLHAFGFVTQAMLAYLMAQYTGIDFSNVEI